MHSSTHFIVRTAVLSVVAVPCVAWADALPPDRNDIYYHCTPAEQCPEGSEACPSLHGPAGHTSPDAACAARALDKKLEQRCAGSSVYLYCPSGASGSWKGKVPTPSSPSAPRKGCS